MNKKSTYRNYVIIAVSVLAVFIWLVAAIYAEKSKPKPEPMGGIFSIQLGKSEEEIRAIIDEKELHQHDLDDSHLGIKKFALDRYEVADSYILEELKLEFWDDKLYAILIEKYNKKTEDLLTEKYGLKNEEIDIMRGNQNRYEEKDWNTYNYDVECYSKSMYYEGSLSSYTLMIRDKKRISLY